VFYLNVPIGLAALALAWAAAAGGDTPRTDARLDLPGTFAFTVGLAGLLLGITLLGEGEAVLAAAALLALGRAGLAAAIALGLRRPDPFLDISSFRHPGYAGATLVSLLTGYGFATAIIGAAVVVDRVLYGGPADQQVALGALAGATALGALASGWLVRRLSIGPVTVGGILAAAVALAAMARWDPATTLAAMAAVLALFGLGFGATVPRVRRPPSGLRAGRWRAAATVARMIGMAVGLAVDGLWLDDSDRVTDQVFRPRRVPTCCRPSSPAGRRRRHGRAAPRPPRARRPVLGGGSRRRAVRSPRCRGASTAGRVADQRTRRRTDGRPA
jgi:hypothetical protein